MSSAIVRSLLQEAGTTYAEQAGIKLADKPSPLYRLLVLSVLLSTRIRADIAVATARELREYDSPRKMRDATWQERVDALGRGGYVRYDESTSTALGKGADLLLERYQGDLRKIRKKAGGNVRALRGYLREVPNLGPVGVDIFCREAQAVWPELRPYLDKKALSGAEKLGLPKDPAALADQVQEADLAPLAAALVRVTLEKGTRERVTS